MDRHGEKEKESRIDCTVYIRGQRMEKKKEEKSKKEKENNWKKKKGRTNKNTDDIAGCWRNEMFIKWPIKKPMQKSVCGNFH